MSPKGTRERARVRPGACGSQIPNQDVHGHAQPLSGIDDVGLNPGGEYLRVHDADRRAYHDQRQEQGDKELDRRKAGLRSHRLIASR
jgi:hypothetical protein